VASERNAAQAEEVELICDFCSSTAPAWSYPAKTFDAKSTHKGRSVGDWLACDVCHRLIEAGDREKLAHRILLCPTVHQFNLDRVSAIDFARRLHGEFFAHRCGPAVPWP